MASQAKWRCKPRAKNATIRASTVTASKTRPIGRRFGFNIGLRAEFWGGDSIIVVVIVIISAPAARTTPISFLLALLLGHFALVLVAEQRSIQPQLLPGLNVVVFVGVIVRLQDRSEDNESWAGQTEDSDANPTNQKHRDRQSLAARAGWGGDAKHEERSADGKRNRHNAQPQHPALEAGS